MCAVPSACRDHSLWVHLWLCANEGRGGILLEFAALIYTHTLFPSLLSTPHCHQLNMLTKDAAGGFVVDLGSQRGPSGLQGALPAVAIGL